MISCLRLRATEEPFDLLEIKHPDLPHLDQFVEGREVVLVVNGHTTTWTVVSLDIAVENPAHPLKDVTMQRIE